MSILQKIIEQKRLEVAQQKARQPLRQLADELAAQGVISHLSFAQALTQSRSGIIAEFKRKSPSKGWIHPDAPLARVVNGYQQAGAAAISVLTDETFFGGSLADFREARQTLHIPLLRKDFIVDEYQVFQSALMGADVILLIAAALSLDEVQRFGQLAHQLGMETLLEIHCEAELDHAQLRDAVDVVGVNNRDLATFTTDTNRSAELAPKIAHAVKISESGIAHPQTVKTLRQLGFRGFLMGENFMKTERPEATLEAFIQSVETLCG
ncbi:MAG: indole-3-glycerol phosphate synthase TrpC [Prevotellaceae bacterium]|jgi:indole-3-glycerol phosphate synthase|nr:indole-3-glycerol phosphate synthase TrpC [Prevotellaceae bacterium]